MPENSNRPSARWLHWSPGHSPRTDEIIEHLTPGERRRYRVASLLVGSVFGVAVAGLSPFLLMLILRMRLHVPALVGALLAYVGAVCMALYLMQWRTGHFLRHTAWSKAQGWDKEAL